MKTSTAILPEDVSSVRQRAALLTLLTDEDPAVYHAVRDKIIAGGPVAADWLRPHTRSNDPVMRRHANDILQHFARAEADTRFLVFCVGHGEDLDLEEGVWLLAQTRYPDINPEAYRALLDSYAADLREQIQPEDGVAGVLAAMNTHLFEELGFHGDQENYYDPENSYLNRVVDRRAGNPISLCILYWLLARRLRLPIVGIAMPGHFLCRYQSSTETFFIDAFNRGKLLTRADCIQHLQRSGHGFQDAFLAPVSPARALLRVCSNLHQICSHRQQTAEVTRFQRYLVALAK
jgi:regulator of sirC expression with transglutaminase-like and TPR domain